MCFLLRSYQQKEANREMLRAKGYTEDQIDEIFKLGETATDAATKVKTFTQLWDVLKEAAQSGWTQTWELLVGDFEQAKALLTPLADFFTNIINKTSEWRNAILKSALGRGLFDMSDKLKKIFDSLTDVITPVTNAIDTVNNALVDYDTLVDQIIRGEWKNAPTRWQDLAAAGYDWAHAQNLVNERLGCSVRHATNYSEATAEVAKNTEKATETTGKLSEEQAKLISELLKLSDAELKEKGYSDAQIKALRELEKELRKIADKLGLSIDDLLANMDKIDGRWLLINSFKNMGQALLQVFNSMKEAWQDIFPPKTTEEYGQMLFDLIAGFHKFSTKLIMSKDTADSLKRTFRGLFAALELIMTIVGGPIKIAFKIFTQLLGAFDLNILDVTAAIGDAIYNFNEWVQSALDFTAIFKKIVPYVTKAADSIKEFFKSIKNSEAVQELSKYLSSAGASIKEFFNNLKAGKGAGKDLIAGLVQGLSSGAKNVLGAIADLATGLIKKFKNILGIKSPSRVFMAIGGFIMSGLLIGLLRNVPALEGFFSNLGSSVSNTLGKIPWGKLFASGVSVGMIMLLKKLADAFETIAAPLAGFGDLMSGAGEVMHKSARGVNKVLKSTAKVIKSFARVLNSFAFSVKARAIKNIAIAIGILVASVIALTFIDPKKLWNAVGVIAVLAVILGGLVLAVEHLSKATTTIDKNGFKTSSITAVLLSIGVTLLLLAATIKMIGSLEPGQAIQGFLGLAGLIVAIGLIFKAYSKLVSCNPTHDIDKVGIMMIKLSAALLLMTMVMKRLAKMTWADMGKAAVGILGFVGITLLLSLIAMIPGRNVDKAGGMILKIAGAFLIMTMVAKIIARMTWDDMGKAAVGILGLVGVVALLTLITKLAGGKLLGDIGDTLLKISGAMLILVGVAKMVASMSWGDMGKAAVGLLGLTGVIALLVLIVKMVGKDAPRIAGTLFALSISIGILAAVAMALSLIDLKGLAKGITAVGLLSAFMAAMLYAARGVGDIKGTLMGMAVAIGVLTLSIVALTFVDPKKLIGPTIALGAILGMFALVLKSGSTVTTSMGTLLAMTAAIAVLATALYLLARLPIEQTLAASVGLSVLLLSMAASMALIGTVGSLAKSGLIALALITGVVVVLAVILNKLQDIPIESSLGIAASLSALLLAMSASLVILGVVGMMGWGAFIGIAALAALIVGIGGLIVGIGYLMTKFPQLESFLNKGLPVLGKIGTGIGQFVGSMVSAFANEVMTILPALGASLSAFMVNLTPFIAGAKAIDVDVLAGIAILSASIILLTAANLISGLTAFIPMGGSFATLGAQLSAFMISALPFITMANMIKPEAMNGIKTLAGAILILTGANLIEGLGKLFGGESSLASFGSQLGQFALDLKSFVTNLGTFTEEQVTTVTCAGNAVKALAEAAKTIPNEGGWAAKIFGENSLAAFGAQLPQFALDLKGFITNLGTLDEASITTVDCACNVIKGLAEAAKKIPNEGGWAAKIFGDNSLATFGSKLPQFALDLKGFITNLGTFGEDKITTAECAGGVIKSLAEAAKKIPNEGGWAAKILGDNSLATFGSKLPGLATNLSGFVSNLGTFGEDKIATVNAAVKAIKAIAQLGDTDIGYLNSGLTTLGNKLEKFAKKLSSFVDKMNEVGSANITSAINKTKELIELAKTAAGTNVESLSTFGSSLKKVAKDGVNGFIKEFEGDSPKSKVTKAAKTMMNALTKGFEDKKESVGKKAKSVASSAAGKLKSEEITNKAKSAGKALVNGFAEGITAQTFKAEAKAAAMANAAEEAARKALDINSPSKVFRAIGYSVPEGFAMGIDRLGGLVTGSVSNMANGAISGVKTTIARISDAVNTDIDTQPTIRPVLDLSDVTAGAGVLSGMFDTTANVGVSSNIRSISSMMNKRQNGQNDEVISAIKDLSASLGNNSGDSYYINGVSYDGESGVADAIKTIARAALVERRI